MQTAFEHPDVDEVVEVLQKFSGKRPYIWTPTASSRKATPKRAAWFGCSSYSLDLNGYSNLYYYGAARGVRKKSSNDLISAQESPQGAAQKSRSLPRKTCHTYEEILTIAKQYMSPHSWEEFRQKMEKK